MILAIDQGTTGTTCLVFDDQAELIGRAYREFEQHFPEPGWVEHDADEIWQVTQAVAGEALDDAGWARTGVYHWPTTEVRTVEWIGRHTVHEGTHHLRDIAQQETQSA